jgi:hypothetical protein
MWQIISKKIGKPSLNIKEIKLKCESSEITHLKDVAELFNSYFSRKAEELLKQTVVVRGHN